MIWHKWVIPHRDTHKKAHLISWQAILVYILLFGLLQLGFKYIALVKPGILGIASNVNQQKLIELTNAERQKLGLGTLTENSSLDQAAAAKGANMFEENYWAHYSPSGKDPWGFIKSAGYSFTVAGENLAKNFQNSDDVVVAWMNSPSHRDNIVNGKYKEIGIAVVNGTLNGEETTLVVQMFGTPASGFVASVSNLAEQVTSASPTPTAAPLVAQTTPIPTVAVTPVVTASPVIPVPVSAVAATQNKNTPVLIDPFRLSQGAAMSIISLMFILLLVDLYVLRRRGVFRITSNHIAHMSLLAVAAGVVMNSHPGELTTQAASVVTNYLWMLP